VTASVDNIGAVWESIASTELDLIRLVSSPEDIEKKFWWIRKLEKYFENWSLPIKVAIVNFVIYYGFLTAGIEIIVPDSVGYHIDSQSVGAAESVCRRGYMWF